MLGKPDAKYIYNNINLCYLNIGILLTEWDHMAMN